MQIKDDGRTVTIMETADKERELFNRLVEWCKKHSAYSGESIMQMDGPQIDAAPFLSDLVDEVLSPKVEWDD